MTTKRLVRISYFTMLTIIGGLISIELPFAPTVKITFQVLFVAMSGLVLGARDGAYSQIVYMALGLVGVPVFSRGGGIAYVLQPSFGYILGFPFQAFLTGLLMGRQKTLSSFKLFLCALAGIVVSYAIGITYQVLIVAYYLGNGTAAALSRIPGVLLMFVKDAVLIYVLCLVYPRIMTMIGKPNEKLDLTVVGPDSEAPSPGPEENEGEEKDGKKKEKKKTKAPVPEPAGMSDC